MAKKSSVKKYPRYDFAKAFLAAAECDTNKSANSYLYWKYIAEVVMEAFHSADDDAAFDFVADFIARHQATIRAKHPELLSDECEAHLLWTDEDEEAWWNEGIKQGYIKV